MKFEWKRSDDRYTNGENMFVNGVLLGSYYWAGGSDPRGSNLPPYRVASNLPGFKFKNDRYSEQEDARKALEAFTIRWFERFKQKETP